MASSKPLTSFTIKKGQSAMVCELCEIDPKLKWKCLDCRRMMCDRCRNTIHPKFPSAEDHTIIDIKDISKYQEEQKLDFTQLKCTKHAGQNCCLFCKPCEELVCPVCISKTHNKHEMTEINEGYQVKVGKLGKRQKEINGELKSVSIMKAEIRKIKFLEQSNYNKSKQGILDYKKSLIESVEKHCDKHLDDLDQKWDDISQSIQEADQKSEEAEGRLLQQNDEVNKILQSRDAKKVFSSNKLLTSKDINIKPIQTTFDRVPKFIPGDLSKISLLHGRLQKVTGPYNIDLKVNKALTTHCESIYNIIPYPDDTLWINDKNMKVVQKVKQTSSSCQVVSKKCYFKMYVADMIITSNGDVLLSVIGSSVIKVIPSGTEKVKDSPYNVSPLQPIGMHVTQDNKIIIETKDNGPAFPATGPRQVIILDQSGQQEKVFQYDKHNQALFTFPIRVTSTSNNNIGVVDMLSEDDQGRVVILNNEGEVINTYTSHLDVNKKDKPFTPADIITTPSDNFIITDPRHHTLHILSSNGEMITYYNTMELGIKLPVSLSFSQTGQLYIGCGIYEDSEQKAKIYKLDNFIW